MTQEQYEILKKYEEQLSTAKICNYVRRMYATALEELDNLYKEMFPSTHLSIKSGCSSCVLKALKQMAEPYFQYKEKAETKETKVETKVEETKVETETEITETKPKKTNGTKSKSGTKTKSRKTGKTS